jgi:chemotaxis protein MotB
MKTIRQKTIILGIALVSVFLFSSCTNWKKEHDALNVKHQNLRGRYELEKADRGQLAEQLSTREQRIAELQRQIEELGKSPADAGGFDPRYKVAFDPDAGTITVTLDNKILFNSGKAKLKKATSAELDHIESVLESKYRGLPIDVVGHTDSDPIKRSGWRDNWQLSAERALAVVGYLIKRGIPDEQIRAVGCGPARPVASNSSAAGKAKNRRVEIVVYMR